MFEYDQRLIKDIKFTLLYPPEGDSSILEVSSDTAGDFLHVMMTKNGDLILSFMGKSETNLTKSQIDMICDEALRRLQITDSSLFE
jgi:hypothetical protein